MNFKKILFVASISLIAITSQANASMAGLCSNGTQYICCPANGGWIVSSDCNSGASPYCANDTGLIAGSNPPVTILQDCKNRGGSSVMYPFSKK